MKSGQGEMMKEMEREGERLMVEVEASIF